jgi:methionyl-tRNA formyltransferase
MALRIVFMGTPDFSVPTLSAIIAAGHDVVAVYSQPPRPAGRGMAERKSPVHLHAETAGIEVLVPRSLRSDEASTRFRSHAADVAVVVAYGLILPKPVLDAPRHGCLNLHASALPRWRGAAPIQRAIMAGDRETAVMVMQMEAGLDTGPVCLTERLPIGPDTTAGELHDELAARGARLMVQALARIEQGSLQRTPQTDEGATYAGKIEKHEARIDFAEPAREVHNRIRGLSPFPGAWFEIEVGGKVERIKILRSTLVEASPAGAAPGTIVDATLMVACADGAVRLIELQRAGKRPMSAEELLRGFPIAAGMRCR